LQTEGAMKTCDGGASSSMSCGSIWALVSAMAEYGGEDDKVVVVVGVELTNGRRVGP